MKKFNVGIQLYGLRNTMAKDFEGTIKAVAEMGYEYVEFAGYYGKSAVEIKEILEKYGLKCVSVHQKLDFYNDDPQAAADFLKTFGVKYSVVPWHAKENLKGGEGWEETVRVFTEIGELLRKNGMKLGYHNHDFEFDKFEGKTLHDYLFEAIPAELMDPEFDTCWVAYAGYSPVEKLMEYKGRVEVVHLKDFVCKELAGGPAYELIDKDGNSMKKPTRDENGFEFRPLGQGRQDFAAILAACEAAGTETVIVEQDRTYGDMTELEAARLSREYLKNTFGI